MQDHEAMLDSSAILIFPKGDDLCFRVRLQPGARQDQVVGIRGDALKVQVSAPPLKGRANRRLVEFLADQFGIAKSRLAVISGQRSRDKTISIKGASEPQLKAALHRLLETL